MKLRCLFTLVAIFLSIQFTFGQEDEPCGTALPIINVADSCSYITMSVNGATSSAFTPFPCSAVNFMDVWYCLFVPPGTTSLTINVQGTFGTIWTYVYRGPCPLANGGNIACGVSATPPYLISLNLTSLSPPETLFVRIGTTSSIGTFGTCAYDSTIVGINKLVKEEPSIFPNPVDNTLNFSLNQSGDAEIIIQDLLGKVIIKKRIRLDLKNSISTSELAEGVYAFTVVAPKFTYTKKIVIQRR